MSDANQKQAPNQAEIELAQKAAQPIDVNADYKISGRTIANIYTIIDEIPMKFAKILLPELAVNLEKIED